MRALSACAALLLIATLAPATTTLGAVVESEVKACTTDVPAAWTGYTTSFAWGVNWYGQLTSPLEIEPRPYPLIIGSTQMKTTKITGGFMHNGVVDAESNNVFVAGLAESGQLASGPTILTKQTQYLSIPFVVDDVEPDVLSRSVYDVAGGADFSCVITQKKGVTARQGQIFCAGLNDFGQLGRSDTVQVSYLQSVQSTLGEFNSADFVSIAAGTTHMAALTSTGNVWTWGSNTFGEMGNGNTKNTSTPTKVDLSDITKIGCGFQYCMALKRGGTLLGWGVNGLNQLGDGVKKFSSTPITVATDVSDFSCGGEHVLAIINNQVYSWGSGTMGATGQPKNIAAAILENWSVKIPTAIPEFAGVKIRSIAAGGKHSLVLDTCGNVYTFGSDALGQLGLGKALPRSQLYRSLRPRINANIAKRKVKPVAVYASWFNSFVVTEETTL